ncbi:hypothetical protein [Hymenobacter sp. GOD-10R]|uniref:hypothetical protein n=1 Tax=Hymenobacter sp. GOD-10R TaxID=3093922 RepID=UPI002D78E648|nr:hypothetical protein [Hymenobacter sp. GOD-10R]WRQ31865.1 hypothetical protein SD425_29415 [Hymenobacter sp. GOD-10R]
MDELGKQITRYRQAALLHGRATATGDYQAGNQQYDQLASVYSALKSQGPTAVALLGSLLQDEDDSVACWAATHLLPYQEAQAIATLTRVAATSGIVGFTASITLEEWQARRLKPD